MTEKESRFPIIIEKCPNCGSKERITQLAYDEEVEKGRAQPALASDANRIATPLTEPAKAVLTVNTLVKYYDDCARCGTRYCVKVEIVQARIMPPGGMFKSNPRYS